MRRDRTVPRIDNHSSRDDVVPKSESTSASNSGDTDENDKWLAAANLFLQQAAESAAADRAGISSQSGSGPTSSEQKLVFSGCIDKPINGNYPKDEIENFSFCLVNKL